ncbi:hypothetical protein H257_19134 [Aphanomyces astaci]|uniref:Uncharacterized protein n=1 Tax=Aphanomyces astaci TaxID=112090 RepID=W4F8Z9_APHAT|nr:hypothetical protein H257_19134 [Aphanomyces astaci]ETV63932.1 hypothetical protein H257_19134 [Aphanomyces astaci]|eukprot:XP_009846584.1 hypothetical protein H257_19134 [Aphanomyces astaci]
MILDSIILGQLTLDHPPNFIKQILPPDEIAIFSDQMRVHYGYLQVPLKASMKISPDVTSPALGRQFFPANPKTYTAAVTECDKFRGDLHSCHIHPEGRKLIVLFNSKVKAAHWRDRLIPLRGQPTTLRHYRRPEDPLTALDTAATEQSMVYSFRLLHVPTNIKALQIWELLTALDIDIRSIDQAQNLGSGESDVNRFLVVTGTPHIPSSLAGRTRIAIGTVKVGIYHFQDSGNMPYRKCAALDHPVERCNNPNVQSARIILMPPDMWITPKSCAVHGLASFADWRLKAQPFVAPKTISTQTAAMAATHEAGSQATMILHLTHRPTRSKPACIPRPTVH